MIAILRGFRWNHLLVALCMALSSAPIILAAPVPFDSVLTTFHGGTEAELREAIDGADVGRHGWFVAPQTDQPQAAIFRAVKPVGAAAMDITLCFLSGRPNSFFGDFTVSVTTDPQPTMQARWTRLNPLRFSATGPELTLSEDGHLRAEGSAGDAVFQLAVRAEALPITGFRVDVFPSRQVKGRDLPQVSGRPDGDFVLTEFRVEALTLRTTNIARGQPVSASHPLRFPAETLTDGLPGTFSHPLRAGLGSAFFFEIDLGAVHKLDHIALRNRGDGTAPERLSRVTIELFDAPPAFHPMPAWKGWDRANGSHSDAGEVDVIRAGNGEGVFSGRWLRVSSDSPVAFSPQLAEVEVYEDLGLELGMMRGDGVALSTEKPLRIPPGIRWLSASMNLARGGVMEGLAWRWRFRGHQADWQPAVGLAAEGACPPPGNYVFETQVRHTDGEWNSEVLAVPVEVRAHLWQTSGFQALLAASGMLVLAWLVRYLTRWRLASRMAALEANAALDTERARIARDMHDEVGARLSQLAMLLEMIGREHVLSGDLQRNLLQLAQTTRRVVASLDEVVWAVNPKNDTLSSLAGYLQQCATGYLGPVEIACRLDAPLEWPAIEVRAPVRHHIVLAFREALQNILKHSGATEVTLKLRLEAAHFVIVLADNGCGLPDECGGLGKDGLVNMSARLFAIGGACEVRPRTGGGTEVEMRVRLANGPFAPHS